MPVRHVLAQIVGKRHLAPGWPRERMAIGVDWRRSLLAAVRGEAAPPRIMNALFGFRR